MTKRLFDLCFAALLVIPVTFIIILALIWIKFDSPGPGLFKQTRVGRNKIPFTMYKLRTMQINTGDHASHETSASQITKVGKILRKTKIDELPQIWSVLRGDMSFVGPRPCLPLQTELIEARLKWQAFSVLPGITGPAQIANIDMSMPLQLAQIDGQYVSEQSLRLDLTYIWVTAFGRGAGDAVK